VAAANVPTWPPPWALSNLDATEAETTYHVKPRAFPPTGWPHRDNLDYANKLITTALLLLALPWLAYKLLTRPGVVLREAGRHHLG
jgi:hypothetical protein